MAAKLARTRLLSPACHSDLSCWLQEIEALIRCHKEHPYAKFWGKCNQVKWELDACFREEKALNRCERAIAVVEIALKPIPLRGRVVGPRFCCLCRAINSEKSKKEKARYQEKLHLRAREPQAEDGTPCSCNCTPCIHISLYLRRLGFVRNQAHGEAALCAE